MAKYTKYGDKFCTLVLELLGLMTLCWPVGPWNGNTS